VRNYDEEEFLESSTECLEIVMAFLKKEDWSSLNKLITNSLEDKIKTFASNNNGSLFHFYPNLANPITDAKVIAFRDLGFYCLLKVQYTFERAKEYRAATAFEKSQMKKTEFNCIWKGKTLPPFSVWKDSLEGKDLDTAKLEIWELMNTNPEWILYGFQVPK